MAYGSNSSLVELTGAGSRIIVAFETFNPSEVTLFEYPATGTEQQQHGPAFDAIAGRLKDCTAAR